MNNKSKPENSRSKLSADGKKARRKSSNAFKGEGKDKPGIVKDVPASIGRHGTDQEKDLNPEE
jgi:hypothetical protein